MKMLLVRGYGDSSDYTLLPIKSRHDAYIDESPYEARINADITKFIARALEAAGLTEADIISMSVVPSSINGRDIGSLGSHDYYILCRSPR